MSVLIFHRVSSIVMVQDNRSHKEEKNARLSNKKYDKTKNNTKVMYNTSNLTFNKHFMILHIKKDSNRVRRKDLFTSH